jgi:hypothetical protein
MYGEVPHPPLRSPAMCLQKLCTGAKATPKSSYGIRSIWIYWIFQDGIGIGLEVD